MFRKYRAKAKRQQIFGLRATDTNTETQRETGAGSEAVASVLLSWVFSHSLSAVMVGGKCLASDEMDILILKAAPAVENS